MTFAFVRTWKLGYWKMQPCTSVFWVANGSNYLPIILYMPIFNDIFTFGFCIALSAYVTCNSVFCVAYLIINLPRLLVLLYSVLFILYIFLGSLCLYAVLRILSDICLGYLYLQFFVDNLIKYLTRLIKLLYSVLLILLYICLSYLSFYFLCC